MEEKEVFVNNLKINYKIAGSGQSILILHGWGTSSDAWIHVQEFLVKQGYKVIIPDFPGFGKSEILKKAWGVEDYSNCINEFTNLLNLEKFFLLGHSFGGRICIRFSNQHKEKIIKLILCDPAGIKLKPGLKTRIILLMALIGNIFLGPKILARFKDYAKTLFYFLIRHRDYAKANSEMKETLKKVLEEDLLSDLSKIKIKTLLIWGEKDKMVPLKNAFVFKNNIENSELKIFSKTGHSPNLEIPEKLSETILNFIKS